MKYPVTPDGRYFVHRERLWRCTDPRLTESERARLTGELMAARRAVGVALRQHDGAADGRRAATCTPAKVALGERGPVWWPVTCADDADHEPQARAEFPLRRLVGRPTERAISLR